LLEAFAEGTDVDVENGAFQVDLVLLGDDRLFRRIHAAHGRAVIVIDLAGSYALDEGHVLGVLLIGRSQDLALVRSGGGEDPLELERRDHVGKVAKPELRLRLGVEQVEAGREDDGAHVDGLLFSGGHLMVDGARLAGVHAQQALATAGAGEAPGGLGYGLFLGDPEIHLAKIPALGDRQRPHDRAGHLGHLGEIHLGPDRLWFISSCPEVFASQMTIDGFGRPAPGAERIHREGRPRHRVTAGEHSRD
jgi:hypothetical protein